MVIRWLHEHTEICIELRVHLYMYIAPGKVRTFNQIQKVPVDLMPSVESVPMCNMGGFWVLFVSGLGHQASAPISS